VTVSNNHCTAVLLVICFRLLTLALLVEFLFN